MKHVSGDCGLDTKTHALYGNEARKTDQKTKSDALWKKIQGQDKLIKDNVEKYIEKCPKVEEPTKSSIPLERLPLPKFHGQKQKYHRFKVEFERHVKYSDPDERLLALKEKCLTKQADKDRVANEQSLEKCFEKLDGEYGNLDTTVADIFKEWKNLKTPSNDQQLVSFIDTIENGISCLQSIDRMNELTSSAIINIEENLPKTHKDEISKLIVSKKPEKSRQDIVLEIGRAHV